MRQHEILERIKGLVTEYFSAGGREFVPGKTRIRLNEPTYDAAEANEAIESILTTWVTMGKRVQQFERLFAEYIGVKYAVMVNSGSSANLIALSALVNPAVRDHLQQGDEIITPAVTWSTTVFPMVNVGAVPVFVDVDLETLTIDARLLEQARSSTTRAVMPVHLLGNPCDITAIKGFCQKHKLFLVEDCCEAHGAEVDGKKVGSFGHAAAFSFFFSHHISTVEGGMVLTDDRALAEVMKGLRAHGWIREMEDREELARRNSGIDSRFLFVNVGYNLRPTDIQGAFGIHQMPKLDSFIAIRQGNADFWHERLSKYSDKLLLHGQRKGTRHVWFGYPVTVREKAGFSREELTAFLEGRGIETRPIMAGNIVEQPVAKLFKHRIVGDLKNSRYVMRNSFFFGNHQGIGEAEREYVAGCFEEFLEGRTRR